MQISTMRNGTFLLLIFLSHVEAFQPTHSTSKPHYISLNAVAKPQSSIENDVLSILGDGKLSLSSDEESRLNQALSAAAAAARPKPAPLDPLVGQWELLYTTKSNFDITNPLGKRSDGTAPGLEQIFQILSGGGGGGSGAAGSSSSSSSPVQRFVTGLESVKIYQNIELDANGKGRVDQLVKGPDGSTVLRLSAAAAFEPELDRIGFMFDLAYFVVFGVRVPYPVPFKLLGDEAAGFLDTIYVSEKVRVSKGNKGTSFILRKAQ